jgi:hypothetical protein
MKRSIIASLCVVVLGFSSIAHAVDRDITVHNSIGTTIRELYMSPTSTTTWGSDVLGSDVLAHGRSVHVMFRPGNYRGQCMFDIKIVESDGSASVVSGINLCTITDVTFSRSGDEIVFESE